MPDLPYLASRLLGTPLLIARPKLDVILRAVGPRLLGTGALLPLEQPAPIERNLVVTPEGIALVPVVGTLVARSGWLDAASGLTSYPELAARIAAAMADPAIRAVLLEVDSPGGELGGLFDLVETIRELKTTSGKPLWAVASENALSAAYAIASTADRLWVTRTGEIGLIGGGAPGGEGRRRGGRPPLELRPRRRGEGRRNPARAAVGPCPRRDPGRRR